MKLSRWMAIGLAGMLALLAGLALWLRNRRKSAVERERERRLAINEMGRITDGILVEAEAEAGGEQTTSGLLFYRYNAKGLEYSAAQDISALVHLTPPGSCLPGVPVQVKYHPRRPSDSIILCEQWSGLPSEARRPVRGR
jgi:hypothetical protein